jgi:hypothetical protein
LDAWAITAAPYPAAKAIAAPVCGCNSADVSLRLDIPDDVAHALRLPERARLCRPGRTVLPAGIAPSFNNAIKSWKTPANIVNSNVNNQPLP